MKSKLLIVACLVIVLSMSLILPLSIVNADYSDIINDPNSIVNFNQYILNDKINGTYTVGQNYSNNLPVGQYYINIDSSDTADILLVFSGGGYYRIQVRNGGYSNILTISNEIFAIQFDNNITYTNFNAINLSQMFGENNTPNLEQVHNLFVADYYPYNTGTSMSISGVNSYQQGYNDALDNFSIVESSASIVDSIFNVNAESFSKTFSQVTQAFTTHFFNGVIGIPLGFTLVPNDLVTIDFKSINIMSSNQYHFEIGYYSNGMFVPIDSYNVDDFTYQYSIGYYGVVSFNVPVEMNTIFIQAKDITGLENHNSMSLMLFTITARTTNAYSGLKVSWDQGYNYAKDYYTKQLESYYYGGSNYNRIYQLGYTQGQNDENPYTFGSLMTSVVEAPLQAVLSIFNFDFLGYNFRNVITLILTVCIILAIIRLFIGMGASE